MFFVCVCNLIKKLRTFFPNFSSWLFSHDGLTQNLPSLDSILNVALITVMNFELFFLVTVCFFSTTKSTGSGRYNFQKTLKNDNLVNDVE